MHIMSWISLATDTLRMMSSVLFSLSLIIRTILPIVPEYLNTSIKSKKEGGKLSAMVHVQPRIVLTTLVFFFPECTKWATTPYHTDEPHNTIIYMCFKPSFPSPPPSPHSQWQVEYCYHPHPPTHPPPPRATRVGCFNCTCSPICNVLIAITMTDCFLVKFL